MTQEPKELAADLFALWEMGAVLLPQMAVDFSASTTEVHRTHGGDGGVFRLPGTSERCPSYGDWSTLRDLLQEVLRDTSVNLAATGEALIRIMNDYAGQDENSAARLILEGDIVNRLGPNPYGNAQPPPEIPPAPAPNDPMRGSGPPRSEPLPGPVSEEAR